VEIGPLSPGGPFTVTITGKTTVTLHDVLVGEVWVCSGQSNMEMWVGPGEPEPGWSSSGVANYQDEVAHADYPMLHLLTVEKAVAGKPQRDLKGRWAAAGPKTVNDFSAVGYFFGRELLKTLRVPIGLIHSSWGGSEAEAWTSRATLESDPEFNATLESEKNSISRYPEMIGEYERQFAQWKQSAQRAESGGMPVPPPPKTPDDPRQNRNRRAGLYNGMLTPLTSYAIRGVIWYQGESNSLRPTQYRKLFSAMIRDWRRAWGEGDFPFLFVQLANWGGTSGASFDFPQLREAQLLTLSEPRTAMAVAIDIGDSSDIHPKNKEEVGHRLALAAEAVAYGRDVSYSGPIYDSLTVEGDKIRLRFKYVYGGLTAMTMGQPAQTLTGFEIAGDDRKFLAADARIEGETVVVYRSQVLHPAAVRYAWAMDPICNLYNRAGLPASPFRTDENASIAPK
jgi:sialate O-acetylesterase